MSSSIRSKGAHRQDPFPIAYGSGVLSSRNQVPHPYCTFPRSEACTKTRFSTSSCILLSCRTTQQYGISYDLPAGAMESYGPRSGYCKNIEHWVRRDHQGRRGLGVLLWFPMHAYPLSAPVTILPHSPRVNGRINTKFIDIDMNT